MVLKTYNKISYHYKKTTMAKFSQEIKNMLTKIIYYTLEEF